MGTFQVVDGVKVGGNVASYFCLNDGTVIHAVAGPLNPQQYLREAKWAVDVRKLAVAEAGGDVGKYRATLRRAHQERLAAEYGGHMSAHSLPRIPAGPPVPSHATLRVPGARKGGTQGQVHTLLAYHPLPKLAQLYPVVFEGILKERISTLPVQSR